MKSIHINQVIFTLLTYYLLIDALSGFLILGLGIDLKLSIIYKSLIILLVAIYICSYDLKYLLIGLVLFLALILGEIVSVFFYQVQPDKTGFIIAHVIKLLTPFTIYLYLTLRVKNSPASWQQIKKAINVNCIVYFFNLCLGIMGYGFSTYGGEVNEQSVGVKGFFYAGNEVSMLLVVFSTYLLTRTYLERKLFYVPLSLVLMLFGVAVSTKTAIIATVILACFIPLIIERKKLFDVTKAAFYFLSSFFVGLAFLLMLLVDTLMSSNIYARLLFIYEKQGILGILLSSRDKFLVELYQLFSQQDNTVDLLFGKGVSFFAHSTKYSAELDFPDVLFWHGVVGVAILLLGFIYMTYRPFKKFTKLQYPFAAPVLLTNLLLLAIANISGHVFTSGMLGLAWPLLIVMAGLPMYSSIKAK